MNTKLLASFVAASRRNAGICCFKECCARASRSCCVVFALATFAIFSAQLSTVFAQGTAFTYQGRLTSNSSNYTGSADFQATLWNAPSSGTALANNSPALITVSVTNGLFVLPLDFGASFQGADNWLQLEVRTSIGSFTLLSPRQKLTAAPYAIYAGNAGSAANLTGAIALGQLPATVALRAGGNTFSDPQTFNGSIRLDNDFGFSQSSRGDFFIDAPFIPGGRFTVLNDGRVGIGTIAPQQQLSVATGMNLDQNDGNTGSLVNGLRFGSGSGEGIASKRDSGGNRWGLDFYTAGANRLSISNNGNVALPAPGSLYFGEQTRQMLNLWGTAYAIGVQSGGHYFRTDREFRWYQGGVHVDGSGSGGGITQMVLNEGGSLYVRGVFGQLSDRNVKQNFEPVNGREVLEKVAALPLSTWSFKSDGSKRHMGPMSQDFHAAFNLGGDDKRIATVDADGVALAAIQGLNEKLEQALKAKDAHIKMVEKRNAAMERRLEKLEKFVSTWAAAPSEVRE